MKTRQISFAFGLSMAFALMTIAGCGKKSAPPGDTDSPADSAAPAAPAEEPAAQEEADGTLTIDLERQLKPWTSVVAGRCHAQRERSSVGGSNFPCGAVA